MMDMPVSRLPNAPNSYTNGCILYTMWGRSCSSALQEVAGGQHEKRRFISLHIHSVPCHIHLHHIPIWFIHSFFVPSICTILETSSQLIIAPSTEIDITLLSFRIMEGDLGCNWCKAQKDTHVRDDHQHLLYSKILLEQWNDSQNKGNLEDLLMNPWQSLRGFEPFNCMGLEKTVLFPAERLEIPTFPLKGCSHLLQICELLVRVTVVDSDYTRLYQKPSHRRKGSWMNINDALLKIISTKEISSAGLIGTLLSESREGRQVKGYIV